MDEDIYILPDFVNTATNVTLNLLPEKSKEKYQNAYNCFLKWQKSNNTSSFSENILLEYFHESAKTFKPSTLWANYSMLKSTISAKNNIDISKYHKLLAFLKQTSVGYSGKKSKVFTSDEIEKFLYEAPDEKYLPVKVACIFGVVGACRREELTNLSIDNIEAHGDVYLVKIPNTKTHKPRSFAITGEFQKIVKNYINLRPKKNAPKRLFLNYQKGKCTIQPIGINKIGQFPREIAKFLELPDPDLYTGHSFKRSSSTLLANNSAEIVTLERHDEWKSCTAPEDYTDDSLDDKSKLNEIISSTIMESDETIISDNFDNSTFDTMNDGTPNCSETESTTFTRTVIKPSSISRKNANFHFNNCHVTITNIYKR